VKLKVALGSAVWLLLITVGHLHVNVGWAQALRQLKVTFGQERPELIVGFLPVT
jgi:hypothetical protein